jgi:hypothetical protein
MQKCPVQKTMTAVESPTAKMDVHVIIKENVESILVSILKSSSFFLQCIIKNFLGVHMLLRVLTLQTQSSDKGSHIIFVSLCV